MNFKKILIGAALAAGALGAQAQVASGIGEWSDSFLTLSAANVSGGALYADGTNALPDAAIPYNASPQVTAQGTWLAVGPSNWNNGGGDATLTFGAGVDFFSFLWGSPDDYNLLTVFTTTGSQSYTASALGISPVAGDQGQGAYVYFTPTDAGATFVKAVFSSQSANAFEIANVGITAPVPEPQTYAMMLAGLGVMGFLARRRRKA